MKKYNGINSLFQWQFIAAFSLYFLSVLFFAETGEKEPFKWSQLFFSAMISFVITTSLCWQWRFFGDPHNKANFMLHISFFISCIFFINRLFVKDTTSLSDIALNFGEKYAAKIISWIPSVIFDALRSPGVLILFLMIALSLSFRPRIAVALLILSLFLAVIFSIHSSHAGQGMLWFFAGMTCLGTALYLQSDDSSDSRKFWTTVLARLKNDPALRVELELKTRLLKRIYERQRPITQIESLGIISRALGMEMASPKAQEITRRIAEKLVHQDHLARYVESEKGKALGLNREEFIRSEPDMFAAVAIMPKTVIFVIFAFLWIISPIDLIFDAVPIFGAIDDVIVGTLGFNSILQSITGMRIIRRGQSRNLFPDDNSAV